MLLELIVIILKDGLMFIAFFLLYRLITFIGGRFIKPIRTCSLWVSLVLIAVVLVTVIGGSWAIGVDHENLFTLFVAAVLLSFIDILFPVKQRIPNKDDSNHL